MGVGARQKIMFTARPTTRLWALSFYCNCMGTVYLYFRTGRLTTYTNSKNDNAHKRVVCSQAFENGLNFVGNGECLMTTHKALGKRLKT